MSLLRIEFLGDFRLFRGDVRLRGFPTATARALFSYLVLHRNRLHDRSVLAGTFWGDCSEADARRSLRTNLWRVRRTLADAAPGAEHALVVHDHQIGFNSSADYWLDLEQFELHLAAAARAALRDVRCVELESAVRLYRGHLLEGVYEEWCVVEQARLKTLYLQALETLMYAAAERGDLHAGLAHGERLVAHDPLRETIHRELMRLRFRLGERGAAIRQFQLCTSRLREELGVEPMRETIALHAAIVAERADSPSIGVLREAEIAHGLIEVLRDSATQLERAANALRRSIRTIEGTGERPTETPVTR